MLREALLWMARVFLVLAPSIAFLAGTALARTERVTRHRGCEFTLTPTEQQPEITVRARARWTPAGVICDPVQEVK